MSQKLFALMLFPSDNNFVGIHSLSLIRKPEKLFNEYEVGEEVLAEYPGWMPGPDEEQLWKGVILATSGDQEELKSIKKVLKEEYEKLIPDDFTPEVVTKVIVDLAVSKTRQGETTSHHEPKEGAKGKTKSKTPTTQRDTTSVKKKRSSKHHEETAGDNEAKKRRTVKEKSTKAQVPTDSAKKQRKPEKGETEKICSSKEENTDSQMKTASASKQKKMKKSVEALGQESVFDDLERELAATRDSTGDLMELDCLSITEVLRTSNEVLYGPQGDTSSPLKANEGATPFQCGGCMALTQRMEVMQQTINCLWNGHHFLQKEISDLKAQIGPREMDSSLTQMNNKHRIGLETTTTATSTNVTETNQSVVNINHDVTSSTATSTTSTATSTATSTSSTATSTATSTSSTATSTATSTSSTATSTSSTATSTANYTTSTATSTVTYNASTTTSTATYTTSTSSSTATSTTTSTEPTDTPAAPPQSPAPSSSRPPTVNASPVHLVNIGRDKIYNGYTVEQLEMSAMKLRNFSKAAKLLLLRMFTEEEREGRCLYDYKKRMSSGECKTRQGLADQDKLAALQDIILRCYPVVEEKDLTKRDINQKLSELLKPSAVAKKFGSMEK